MWLLFGQLMEILGIFLFQHLVTLQLQPYPFQLKILVLAFLKLFTDPIT